MIVMVIQANVLNGGRNHTILKYWKKDIIQHKQAKINVDIIQKYDILRKELAMFEWNPVFNFAMNIKHNYLKSSAS